jgi:hypothetical protein
MDKQQQQPAKGAGQINGRRRQRWRKAEEADHPLMAASSHNQPIGSVNWPASAEEGGRRPVVQYNTAAVAAARPMESHPSILPLLLPFFFSTLPPSLAFHLAPLPFFISRQPVNSSHPIHPTARQPQNGALLLRREVGGQPLQPGDAGKIYWLLDFGRWACLLPGKRVSEACGPEKPFFIFGTGQSTVPCLERRRKGGTTAAGNRRRPAQSRRKRGG